LLICAAPSTLFRQNICPQNLLASRDLPG